MTLEQLCAEGGRELRLAGVPEADLCAWRLLQACMGEHDFSFSRSDYFLRREEEVKRSVREQYNEFLEKRKQRMPLEYITGYTEFMGIVFEVDEHVLIPRQDTETVVEKILPYCGGKRVLDLCTGSGCIGLSIGVCSTPARIVLSDISQGALRIARKNLARIRRTERIDADVQFAWGDLWSPVDGRFDVIVSNPPYIRRDVIRELMPEVERYEPVTALDGGQDGMDYYRRILKDAPEYLEPGGMVCFEIGYDQGESVSALMEERGFTQVEITKDLAQNDRVVLGKY